MDIDIMAMTLLTAKQICSKLAISRPTFDRLSRQGRQTTMSVSGSFPAPATYILGTPRWNAEEVNSWINLNGQTRSNRGKKLQPKT